MDNITPTLDVEYEKMYASLILDYARNHADFLEVEAFSEISGLSRKFMRFKMNVNY